jgi:proteic killer suppression protein
MRPGSAPKAPDSVAAGSGGSPTRIVTAGLPVRGEDELGQIGLGSAGSGLDNSNEPRYHPKMIRSFRDREAETIFTREVSRKLPEDFRRGAQRKLAILDGAESLQDLRSPPGNRLEKLYGDRVGQHSIRINDTWRVCFRWSDGDAYEVEIVDYHS